MSGEETRQGEGQATDGERLIAPTRRPDGSFRKEIRIRSGYTPQDEVAIYKSKAALFKKGVEVPPGYDPEEASKPKTKAAKKNEKRKEKKQQSTATGISSQGGTPISNEVAVQEKAALPGRPATHTSHESNVFAQQLGALKVSPATTEIQQLAESNTGKGDLEKRIRALKKKIRLTEAMQTSQSSKATLSDEQTDKLSKLAKWRQELLGLEVQLASV